MITDDMLHLWGYEEWSLTPTGILVCPHGNLCEQDQRKGLAGCGCVSPLVELGVI
jgi:hypothetical protein